MASSLKQLKAWARHVLTATALEEVLGAPNSESRRDEYWTIGYTMMREGGWSSNYARPWADAYATQRIEGRGKHDAMMFAHGYAEARMAIIVEEIMKPITAGSGPDPGVARSPALQAAAEEAMGRKAQPQDLYTGDQER